MVRARELFCHNCMFALLYIVSLEKRLNEVNKVCFVEGLQFAFADNRVIKKRERQFENIVPDTLKWEVNGKKNLQQGI